MAVKLVKTSFEDVAATHVHGLKLQGGRCMMEADPLPAFGMPVESRALQ